MVRLSPRPGPSTANGEQNVTLRSRAIDLLWRSAGRLVRFVMVRHPLCGTIFLPPTDLTLGPMEIIPFYGYRFKIKLGFRQAVHVVERALHISFSTMDSPWSRTTTLSLSSSRTAASRGLSALATENLIRLPTSSPFWLLQLLATNLP
jgi:hypothetical protein